MFHPFTLSPFHPSTVLRSHRSAKAEIHLHTASQWGHVTLTRIKEKPVLKLLSGVLGTPHINKAKAKAKLDKYLAKRSTPALTGIWRSWSKSLCWRGSMGLFILPCGQWVVPAPNSQFENEFNLKTVLDWNRSRIGRFKCFMWRKWTVWSLCEVYVKSSHIGQKWSRWFHWSFYFVNAECKKRLTRINVSKQKSDER